MPDSKKRKYNSKKKRKQQKAEFAFLRHLKPIQPDDTFSFSCSQCADCCTKVKESVAFETIDFFKLSRYLKNTGAAVWSIEGIMNEYVTIVPLTDFWYPMFFINTVEPSDTCIFLKDKKCSIHNAKPRTCRMYPLTIDPSKDGEYKHYIITERKHHFTGQGISVTKWMTANIDSEDREFTAFEFEVAPVIGYLLKKINAAGTDIDHALTHLLYFKYLNFDVDKPFMAQYSRNMESLIEVLGKMTGDI